jgi:DNA-binding NarL/FixJ family response regulator
VAVQGPTKRSGEHHTAIGVGLVAPESALRRRLAQAIRAAGLEVAAEALDAAALADTLAAGSVDVIVVAPRGGASAAVEIRAVSQRLPDVPIVAVISGLDRREWRRAISAGADGAVLDRDLDEALAATVAAAAAGQISFPQAVQAPGDGPSLTAREKQVLGGVVNGLTNAQIASDLDLAESTVKSHLSSAFAKLGVASRAEAAALIRDPVRGRGLDVAAPEPPASE